MQRPGQYGGCAEEQGMLVQGETVLGRHAHGTMGSSCAGEAGVHVLENLPENIISQIKGQKDTHQMMLQRRIVVHSYQEPLGMHPCK